jgi:hypothetical protein
MLKDIPRLGMVICVLYLVAAVFLADPLSIGTADKEAFITRMENSGTVFDACNVARPFISLAVDALRVAKVLTGLSLVATVLNGILFFAMRRQQGAAGKAGHLGEPTGGADQSDV